MDSVHEDYIPRAPSGGLSVDTLVREVTVLERDHNSICDEKENETLKKCRYSSQSGSAKAISLFRSLNCVHVSRLGAQPHLST